MPSLRADMQKNNVQSEIPPGPKNKRTFKLKLFTINAVPSPYVSDKTILRQPCHQYPSVPKTVPLSRATRLATRFTISKPVRKNRELSSRNLHSTNVVNSLVLGLLYYPEPAKNQHVDMPLSSHFSTQTRIPDELRPLFSMQRCSRLKCLDIYTTLLSGTARKKILELQKKN